MKSHVWIYIYEFMSETETIFRRSTCTSGSFQKLRKLSEENRYSGENCDIAIREKIATSLLEEKIAIQKEIARDRTVSKIAHSQTIIFI